MNFSLVYLAERFVYRISNFFHHWYVDGSKIFFHKLVSLLEFLDQTIALRVTLRYFFQPLFKDYTGMGRILGFVFRTGRALIGVVVYVFVLIVFMTVYALWLVVPLVTIAYAIGAK